MIENMKPEDRLAEKLKNDTLGTFFSEEDLLPICKKAIEKAFFEERADRSGYSTKYYPPLVIEYATESLKEEVSKYVTKIFKEIIDDERLKETIGTMMVTSLGGILMDSLKANWERQFFHDIHQHADLITRIVKDRL